MKKVKVKVKEPSTKEQVKYTIRLKKEIIDELKQDIEELKKQL